MRLPELSGHEYGRIRLGHSEEWHITKSEAPGASEQCFRRVAQGTA